MKGLSASIGSLNEKALHADLKAWFMKPGDLTEVPMHGYIIDIVRDRLLVEIQTRNFSAIKSKLRALVRHSPIRLIHPIAKQKWIVKLHHNTSERRKSPKGGSLLQIFDELVSIPELMLEPNFSLQVVTIQEEEVRQHDPRKAWRRKGWVTHERRLLEVNESHLFETPQDLNKLIPEDLCSPFTTADLARAMNTTRHIAQKVAYCLLRMKQFTKIGKQRNAIVYTRS